MREVLKQETFYCWVSGVEQWQPPRIEGAWECDNGNMMATDPKRSFLVATTSTDKLAGQQRSFFFFFCNFSAFTHNHGKRD